MNARADLLTPVRQGGFSHESLTLANGRTIRIRPMWETPDTLIFSLVVPWEERRMPDGTLRKAIEDVRAIRTDSILAREVIPDPSDDDA